MSSPQHAKTAATTGWRASSGKKSPTHSYFYIYECTDLIRNHYRADQTASHSEMPLLTPHPMSHHDVLSQYHQREQALLQTGSYTPFVYPYRAFGPALLILYLLIPPTRSRLVFYARYPLFGVITYLSVSAILECRSAMVTVGYGIGLLNAWAVLWSATLLLFNDARADFRRIEEHDDGSECLPGGCEPQGNATGVNQPGDQGLRARQMNGHAQEPARSSRQRAKAPGSVNAKRYTYEPLPSTLLHRLDWVLDLVSNFRGVRWTHQISGLAPPPPHIQTSLSDPSLPPPTPESHLTRTDLLRRDLPSFLLCLLAHDVLKTLTLQDPYFWSLPASTPSPFAYPKLSRIVLSVTFVYTSLESIYLLAPLIFGVLLGPHYLGQHAWPWLYPPYFGSLGQVWRKGLAGLWGQWWHQLFRYAFEQAGEFSGRIVGWEKKSKRGMLLRVLVAFTCSGALHACASYTTLGDTRPIGGAFLFFVLQPVGIVAQRAVSGWMMSYGLREKLPAWVRGCGNVAVVAAWCYFVGPIVADDFAATGIWLYEPIPISVLRGLRGDGWWCWGGSWVDWYSAGRWWQSGLAF